MTDTTPRKEFSPVVWDERLAEDCRQLVQLAIREDLDRLYDWTTIALVPDDARGRADVVARQPGVVAGLPAAALALDVCSSGAECASQVEDGAVVSPGQHVAVLAGPVRGLLTAERVILNLLARLCGIATLTRQYVDAIADTHARVYDTRKTTPGWRRLEKYAVRIGGGHNHRTGLFDAVLIKDNHLAWFAGGKAIDGTVAAQAVVAARKFLDSMVPGGADAMIVEIEVDSIDMLPDVLAAAPDVVLLDNMSPQQLAAAVAQRDRDAPQVELEASGGIDLQTIAAVAATGVDRISVGALTHAAASLDLGLDWHSGGDA